MRGLNSTLRSRVRCLPNWATQAPPFPLLFVLLYLRYISYIGIQLDFVFYPVWQSVFPQDNLVLLTWLWWLVISQLFLTILYYLSCLFYAEFGILVCFFQSLSWVDYLFYYIFFYPTTLDFIPSFFCLLCPPLPASLSAYLTWSLKLIKILTIFLRSMRAWNFLISFSFLPTFMLLLSYILVFLVLFQPPKTLFYTVSAHLGVCTYLSFAFAHQSFLQHRSSVWGYMLLLEEHPSEFPLVRIRSLAD